MPDMSSTELLDRMARGEDSTTQFKVDVRNGDSLASFVAKGLLPYHGIGSGIKRALADWQDITFTDDRDGCLFTATVRRKVRPTPAESSPSTTQETLAENEGISKVISKVKSKVKNPDRLLQLFGQSADMTIPELALTLGLSLAGVEKIIRKLKHDGLLRRIGPDKGGHWEVIGNV